MQDEIVIKTLNLKKYFGAVHAVEDVSLEVKRSEVFGFLGPNGAGKTTTIGVILSLLHPTAGEAYLFGEPVAPGKNKVLNRVGALVGSPALAPYLSARQNLEVLSRLHLGVDGRRIDEVLELVNLKESAHRKAGSFSTGMKQRLGLAMALLHRPELLILDEPTNGMDPSGMREVRQLLMEMADQGVTVFLSSHLLHEVEQICDRVAVLSRGSIVAQGPVSQLLEGQTVVKVRVPSPRKATEVLRNLPEIKDIVSNGAFLTISGMESSQIVAHLASAGIYPSAVTPMGQDLESLFLELTGEA
jgi:ABC-type multidrug transport system ATPase subunit